MLNSSVMQSLSDSVVPLSERFFQIISAIICVLVLGSIPLELWVPPLARKFRLDNPHINYALVAEHVPIQLLAILTVILPMFFIMAVALVDQRYRRHCTISILGLFLSLSTTMFFTDVLKDLIGNQRPDFIARCMPKKGTKRDQLVSVLDVCTNLNMADVWEGCRSTPSGHSSLSFAGLGFLGLWILFTFNGNDKNSKYVKIASVCPIVLSIYIALTRIVDHRHHWLDILSGSALGACFAWYSYKYVVGDSKPKRVSGYNPV